LEADDSFLADDSRLEDFLASATLDITLSNLSALDGVPNRSE
jgi:hypothetical protein